VLRKVFKYVESKDVEGQKPDADGFKDAMLDFDWAKNIKPEVKF
jgi:hypothetical protein